PGQGAVGAQCRVECGVVRGALAELDDGPGRAAVTVERDALRRAEGGCNTAFGAYCTAREGLLRVTAMIEREERIVTATVTGNDERDAGDRLWEVIAEEHDAARSARDAGGGRWMRRANPQDPRGASSSPAAKRTRRHGRTRCRERARPPSCCLASTRSRSPTRRSPPRSARPRSA